MRKISTFLLMLIMCSVTALAQVIYTTNFATQEDFNTWFVVDSNQDGSTWQFDTSGSYGYVFYTYNAANAANDWLISPEIVSPTDGTVAITINVHGSSYGEKLQLFKGSSTAIGSMTSISEVLPLNDEDSSHVFLVNVTANESFRIAFKACSDADKWRLYIKNITVQLSENPVDLAVTEIISPVSDFNLGNESVKVKIKNIGNIAVDSYKVAFSIDNTEIANETINTPLGINEEIEYTFTTAGDFSLPRKLFTIKAWTIHADDINNDNNAASTTVLHKAPASLPYFMGFEANEYTEGITFMNLNYDDGDWNIYTDPWWSLSHNGDYCLAYNYDKNNNGNDWAFLEPITISEPGYYVLKFWYSGDDTHPEKLGVYYGNDATPEAMTQKIVEYAPFARSAYAESINIINITEPQTIYIGFYAFSDKDENWICVDDVSLEKIESDDIDIAVTSIDYPSKYLRNANNKAVQFSLRNLGITDVEASYKVTIDNNLIANEPITIKTQEIKTISVDGAFANIAEGDHTLTVEVISADDKVTDNNTMTTEFKLLGTPTMLWDFENGIPEEFTFRAEDEGTVDPNAGEEFTHEGWGIFNIVNHADYGEKMLAGTSWLQGTDQADRWCILPPYIPEESSLLVWDAASYNPSFLETYSVMISTNGDDSWYYFTEETYNLESTLFKTRGIDLSEYAGREIYIAYRLRTENGEALVMDNIALYGGKLSGTQNGVDAVENSTVDIVISSEKVVAMGEGVEGIEIYNINGTLAAASTSNEIYIGNLTPAVYMIRTKTATGVINKKFIKK